MNSKALLLIPASLALLAPSRANAYVGFRLNLAVPLYYPAYGYYYPSAGYTQTVAYQAPLRAEGEQVTVAPGPGYVWIAGHWAHSTDRWVWLAGHWELPPSPSAVWVAGHWAQGNGGWVWINDTWAVGGMPSSQPPGPPPTPPSAPAGSAAASAQPPVPQAQMAPAGVPVPSTAAPQAPEMADGMVVNEEPPAPIVEYVPACPYPDYVWIGGFWAWNGGWYWTAGHYGPRPHPGALWVGGGWAHAGRGWAWHGGHWR
ncbi:MAG: hypothetical protein WAN79_08890 [Opitutaceae bacterium]